MRLAKRTSPTTRTLRKDNKNLFLFQLLLGGSNRLTITLATFDGKSSQKTRQPSIRTIKSLLLGHKYDFTRYICWNKGNIGPGKMIGGNNIRPFFGNVVTPTQMDMGHQRHDASEKPAYHFVYDTWCRIWLLKIFFGLLLGLFFDWIYWLIWSTSNIHILLHTVSST